MKRAAPQLRQLARRLIVYERRGDSTAGIQSPAGFSVEKKLRPHLASLMGAGGFRALLARALTLAAADIHWLRAVQVNADGSMSGAEPLFAQLSPAEFLEGRVALLAQLLGLLEAFIGEPLTLRLVREVWPKFSLDDSDPEAGGRHETKDQYEKAN